MMRIATACFFFILTSGFFAPTFASPETAPPADSVLAPLSTAAKKTEKAFSDLQLGVIKTPKGETIGALVDFIFNLRANRLLYAAGVMQTPDEFKNRVLIFPWSVMQADLDLNSFILNGGQTIFTEAPNFSAEEWLNLPTAQWRTAIITWQEKRNDNFAKAPTSDQSLSRASDLIGKTVKTAKGEEVGVLAELLVDPEKNSIAYAIISFADSDDDSHTLFYSLPWTTVQADPVRLTFVVPDFVKKELHDSPRFPMDRDPRLEASVSREMNDTTL